MENFGAFDRLEKIYRGKTFVGLRVSDPDTASRLNIDIVLLTTRKAVVVSVKNFSGFASIAVDGSWLEEVRKQVSVLESYLEQRGVALPDRYLSYRVVLPNPRFRCSYLNYFHSKVITYEKWSQLKRESENVFSGWLKGAFCCGKKDMQEPMLEKLSSVLSTAPMWDRMELNDNKHVLGEFIEFKGQQEDVLLLKSIKISNVGRIIIQRPSMFGSAHSKLQVLYSPRDYRSGAASASEWKEVTVGSSTEVVFKPERFSYGCEFKLSSIISMSLSP